MSKNKRERNAAAIQRIGLTEAESTSESTKSETFSVLGYLRNHLWIVVAIAVLSLGVLGAGLKYLEEDAKKQNALKSKDRSTLSSVNPFVISPPPTPTPQLKVEYIHAGSRLIAVEDANANAAPPADLAVWRPSTGVWWILDSQQTTATFGQSGDIPIPGDYDGDGKTDFCVFRPSNGMWYIVNSSTGSPAYVPFGVSTDKPVAADFDGDGRTDPAVFRGSSGNGVWYILRSSDSGITTTQFGLDSDIPAPADFDGDGKADIAVYRDSNSTFYSLNSANGQLQTANLGSTPGATPVPADYDGDGKANFALKSGADWLIRNSANSATSVTTWQLSSDIPVQNDYDADGKTDIATWRPSNGDWYIRKSASSGALRQEHWGASGDIPVPAFYRR